ncbi:ectoine synthase [Paenibacillus agricola]|uniref:L-ectoine synthase n=1 Tax=Paenibacillus agricola TaxID=2716264 RepID=A0ABX0JA28_9BACL|nr:ectoine synthase [Paenibacillus agricola]NHN33239.1 ectoine synthase [Paenibacillus agricola]
MIVRNLSEIEGTVQDIKAENWSSRRLLLRKDGVGFSMHDTLIKANTETLIWYKNHIEAVYCISGEGEIETVDDGKVYPIRSGTLYVLNHHEKHLLRGKSEMRMVCVFNPPCTGNETHDAEGTYPLIEN